MKNGIIGPDLYHGAHPLARVYCLIFLPYRVLATHNLGSQFGYLTFAGYLPDYGVSLAIMSNRRLDRDSERAIGTVGGAVIDVLLRHLGARESGRQL